MSPTDHPFVKSTLEGARRSSAKSVIPKELLSLGLVQGIASHYMANSSLAVIRFLFVLLVGYAGFLRADEILRMSILDISIFRGLMLVTLPKRKNYQYKEGHSLYLIGSDKVTRPAATSEKLSPHLPESDGSLPLVRRIVRSRSNEKFHDSKGVSYSTIRDEFRKFLKPFVLDVEAYGLHSIKSGATSNLRCRSVVDGLLERHAGWKISASKYRYIKCLTCFKSLIV